jgi:hypothetical protein
MSDLIEDMFKDMANAPPQGQTGNGIKVEGDFLIEVLSTKGNKGHFGPRFIVEFRVLESSVPDEVRVGTTKSWTAKWGDTQSLPDIKAFARSAAADALEGLSEKEKDATATFMAYAAAGTLLAGSASNVARQKLGDSGQPFEGDPFEGLQLRVSTKPSTTKQGFNFVKHRWSVA